MRKLLTITEASKLLSISTHAIRHYEDMGLLKPSKRSEKGYRLYNYDSIELLSVIMILRECEMPIKDIKNLLDDYSPKKYKQTMIETKENIIKEIKRLQNINLKISNLIKPLERENVYNIKTLESRVFSNLKSTDYSIDYSIKQVYDLYRKYNVDTSSFFKDDEYYIIKEDKIILCLPYEIKNLVSNKYPKGKYLCYKFSTDQEDEIHKEIDKFYKYIQEKKLKVKTELLLVFETNKALIKGYNFSIELQIKI